MRHIGPALLALALAASPPLAADELQAAKDFLTAPLLPAECGAGDDRVQVMVLATYHMANPGADVFNLEADDVLSAERQDQVAAMVAALADFQPDRVALEAHWQSETLAANYAAYLAGEAELTRNERQQIGFRLAHALDHSQVYAIDAPGDFDMAPLQAIAAADPEQGARLGRMQVYGGAAIALMGEWLAESTVGEMHRRMNEPGLIARSHQLYIDILGRFVAGEDYAGPDLVGDWYTRNLRIFANLDRIADPGDKVVVLFGAGHAPILRELVETAEDMCLVDPRKYLP